MSRRELEALASSELNGVVASPRLLADAGLWVTFSAHEGRTGATLLLDIRSSAHIDDETIAGVLRAARSSRDIDLTSVLSARRFGCTDELLWIVTPACPGVLLDPVVEGDAAARQSHASGWLRQVVGPLETAHRAGLVHGALGRSSFHRDTEGRVRIRNVQLDTPVLRGCLRAGVETGAGACASPEVRAGSPPAAESDQYALAALVVLALSGHPPGPAGELPGTGIPDALRPALRRALHPDREARFPSGLAMWRALDEGGFALVSKGRRTSRNTSPRASDLVGPGHTERRPERAGPGAARWRPLRCSSCSWVPSRGSWIRGAEPYGPC